jgi:hypothetical protein
MLFGYMKKSNICSMNHIHYPYKIFAPQDILKNVKPFQLVPIIWSFHYYSHQKKKERKKAPISASTPLSHILLVVKLCFIVSSAQSLTHTVLQ